MEKQTGFIAIVLVSLIGLTGAVFLLHQTYWGNADKMRPVKVTVFIHGTVGVSLSLLKPDFISAFRNHPLLEQDQILGLEGLHEFNIDAADPKHASTHIIPVYDALSRQASRNNDAIEKKYLLFGWSGLLSQEARKKAGFELYEALCSYRTMLQEQYALDPEFTIVAHSHGGNVALWLAAAEEELAGNLSIEQLYMLGTPIQVETAPYIISKMFKTVILGYSHGDGIQGNDLFSTENHKSYKRMAHLVDLDTFVRENPGYIRCDMRYIVNRESRRVTHPNMWMMGRSKKLADCIDPLPLVIFVPLFADACHNDTLCTQYTAHLDVKNDSCCTYLTAGKRNKPGAPKIGVSVNLFELVSESQKCVEQEWQSDDKIRSLLFNRKNIWALTDAYKQTYGKKAIPQAA